MLDFALLEAFQVETGETFAPNSADDELRKIDGHLSSENIKEFVLAAYNSIQDKIPLSDRNALGASWQQEITLELRAYLTTYKWELKDWTGGAYLFLSPCHTKCIVVAAGTKDVGKTNGIPMTNARKGKKWIQAALNLNLNLPDTFEFWVLLFHRNANIVQLEMSLPKPNSFASGQITGYNKRIILSDVNLSAINEIERKQSVEIHEPIVERKRQVG